jgi:hypothetical protein
VRVVRSITMNQQERVKSLHDLYQTLSGLEITLTMQGIYTWEAWLAKGFCEDDLRLVIEHLRRKVKDGKRMISTLRFSKLIGYTDYFAEDLAEARALARKPVVDSGKAQALASTGRTCDTPQAKVRTAGEVLRGNEALKKLLELRDSL